MASGIPVSPLKNSPAGALGYTVLAGRQETGQAEGGAAAVLVGIGEGRLPANAVVQGKARRHLEGVLRIEAHDPVAQVVGSGIGLVEIVGRPDHEIGQRDAGARAVEREVSVLLEAGDGVVLHPHEVEPECHLMPPADHVDVVGHLDTPFTLKCPGAQVPQKVLKPPVTSKQQEVRHGAIHVDAEQGRVDRNMSVGPRSSRRRLKVRVKRVQRRRDRRCSCRRWSEDCAISRLPACVVVSRFLPS